MNNIVLNDIDLTITSLFNALSVLFVFVTLTFNMKYPGIQEILNKASISKTEKLFAYEKQQKEYKNTLYKSWLPVVILVFLSAYLVTPLAIKVIIISKLDFINFDPIRTCFVTVFVFLWFFLVTSIVILCRLFKKID